MKLYLSIRYLVNMHETFIYPELENGEILRVGDVVSLPLKDGSFALRTIEKLSPERETDPIPNTIKKDDKSIFMIRDIDPDDLVCDHAESCSKRLTPFEEIRGGELSIYDFVQDGYSVPEKVILYLQNGKPTMMSPGIYQHPFKPGHMYHQGDWGRNDALWKTVPYLLGPYLYGDGEYEWDRDTWKYVVKYGLTLPQQFIDKVMSEEGTVFLDSQTVPKNYWKKMMDRPHTLNLLPEDAGDISLDEF